MSYSVRYDKNYTGHHAGIGGSYNKKDWQLQNNIKSKQENLKKNYSKTNHNINSFTISLKISEKEAQCTWHYVNRAFKAEN